MHLLTVESVKMYRSQINDNGLLAMHVSNRYLRLEPVVAAIAPKNGLVCRIWSDADNAPPGKTESSWILLAKDDTTLGAKITDDPQGNWKPIPLDENIPAWTDDFQDVLRVIRSKELQAVRRRFGFSTPVVD